MVSFGMASVASAATVEALQTDIKTCGIVLEETGVSHQTVLRCLARCLAVVW